MKKFGQKEPRIHKFDGIILCILTFFYTRSFEVIRFTLFQRLFLNLIIKF